MEGTLHNLSTLSDSLGRSERQFSLGGLFKLTLLVSIVLTIGVMCRGSERFHAFSRAWTAVSLVPIVVVWCVYRWRLSAGRRLVLVSVLCYALALAMPAMGGDADGDITWGVQAALMSFLGVEHLWKRTVPIGWPIGAITIPLSIAIACLLGAVANLSYAVGIASCWLARKRPRARRVARRASIVAASLAPPAVVTLCVESGPGIFYPGCGFWIAALLALALSVAGAPEDIA